MRPLKSRTRTKALEAQILHQLVTSGQLALKISRQSASGQMELLVNSQLAGTNNLAPVHQRPAGTGNLAPDNQLPAGYGRHGLGGLLQANTRH